MSDLVAFLRARLDEDEPIAKAFAGVELPYASITNPGRRIREVEAMRAIVDAYTHANGDSPRDRDRGRWDALNAAVRHLAAIWRDHEDYDPGWAGET